MIEGAQLKPDLTLNCLGMLCPMPIIKMSIKIKQLSPGQIIELLADDEAAKTDIPAWCLGTGNRFLKREDAPAGMRFFVQKG